jgi:hypothetical protein
MKTNAKESHLLLYRALKDSSFGEFDGSKLVGSIVLAFHSLCNIRRQKPRDSRTVVPYFGRENVGRRIGNSVHHFCGLADHVASSDLSHCVGARAQNKASNRL